MHNQKRIDCEELSETQLPSLLEEIARDQASKIYNLAYQLTHNPHEAEDLTQETFLKAIENLAGFRREAALQTWLYRITVNTYLARRKKMIRHEYVPLESVVTNNCSGESPERVVIKRELQRCVHHILKHHLPQDYKVVLVLRDLNQLSYEEVAEVLGISVPAVKSRLHRARKAFRDYLVVSGCAALVKDYNCYCEGVQEL